MNNMRKNKNKFSIQSSSRKMKILSDRQTLTDTHSHKKKEQTNKVGGPPYTNKSYYVTIIVCTQ